MLNANNKVNYEPSIKQKEKKYSLSTALAWLYLKTIGRILPEKWNKWAENILYYNKVTADNGVQTDDLLNSDREKELKDENKRLRKELEEAGSKKKENQLNLNQKLAEKEKEVTELKEQVRLLGEEKEGKISSLMQLNEDLEQDKKGMETKNNEQKQKTELESKVSKLKNESDTKIKQLENQLEEKQVEFTQAEEKNAEFRKKLESAQQQLEQEKTNLNAAEKKKKDLESEVNELKEKVQTLEESKEWELAGEEKKDLLAKIASLQENLSIMTKQLKQQQLSSNQERQKLKKELKDLEDIDKKTKAPDAKSMLSTVKSTSGSIISKGLSKLRGNENLEDFLSDQNTKLKEGFPEFEGKHFCHNVLEKTIKSLSNQSDGKFESNKLLALLKENLVKSGKAIIETKVNKVVEELAKDFVKKHDLKQVIFVERCAEKLYLNEEDSKAIIHSFTGFLANRNDSNNDSVKKFVVQKLTEAEMKCFSDKIQGLQLASSIRDKFLSPDQGMCNQTQGEVNEYQLTEKAKKEYKLTPNSSMSHTNSTPVSVKQGATSR